jgi:hypothetical protein
MITNFDIATDVQVELYIPPEEENLFIIGVSLIGSDDNLGTAGEFIIGESLIGGSDVLAPGFGLDWVPVQAVTATAEISIGGEVQDSITFQPESGSCTLTMQSYNFDPSQNSSIRPGTPVRVRVVRDLVDVTLFRGFIDSVNVTYYVDGPNLITIRAYDGWKRFVNTRIEELDTTAFGDWLTPSELMETVADLTGFGYSTLSAEVDGEIPTGVESQVIARNPIYDAINVGLGVSWLDPETQEVVFIPRPVVETTAPTGTYTIGNNHGDPYHLCMSDIVVQSNDTQVWNSLKVSLKSDANTFVIVKNQDAIDLYGEFPVDAEINTTDVTALTAWANEVSSQSPTRLVTSVETPTIDRAGTLTAAAAFTPGTLIGVQYVTDEININDYYTVTKVSHSVNVNNWYTTLELWKEF